MPFYETVFITRQGVTSTEVDTLVDKFNKILQDNDGKVVSTEYWGYRKLAYEIKKNTRGHYVLMNIDAPHKAIQEMERIMKFTENLIRHATFALEKLPTELSVLAVSATAQGYKTEDKHLEEAVYKRGPQEEGDVYQSEKPSEEEVSEG